MKPKERIKEKIEDIEVLLEELEEIMPNDFEDYVKIRNKAACERYFEKIIEAIVDVAFLVIKDRTLKIPEEDKEAFDILADKKIISKELAIRLKDAKGMRNILAHEYGVVKDDLVFNSVKNEILSDSREFIKHVEDNLNTDDKKEKNEE